MDFYRGALNNSNSGHFMGTLEGLLGGCKDP